MDPRIAVRRGAAVAAALSTVAACAGPAKKEESTEPTPIRVAHLGRPDGDAAALAQLRDDFERRNPGYGLDWRASLSGYGAIDRPVVAFVQSGSANARVVTSEGRSETCDPELTVGDVVLLRPGETIETGGRLAALLFTVPEPLPDGLPTFVRPDWDDQITDTPGGCAEETGAYRRILLTWLDSVGPYVYRALNCHRVRITDSFAHYHPTGKGFDEFYLVQMVQPDAVLYTSEATERIEDPDSVTREEAGRLIQKHSLEVGDLVYLPRGTVHRGYGGVLAQIITAPGFRPGAEIGVDHRLRAINERLGLEGSEALPFRLESSTSAVIK